MLYIALNIIRFLVDFDVSTLFISIYIARRFATLSDYTYRIKKGRVWPC